MDREEIGLRIKKLRKELGLTQDELAKSIGRTESSIRKYEKGLVDIPIGVLKKIAISLKVSTWDILGDIEYRKFLNFAEKIGEQSNDILIEFYKDVDKNFIDAFDKYINETLKYDLDIYEIKSLYLEVIEFIKYNLHKITEG